MNAERLEKLRKMAANGLEWTENLLQQAKHDLDIKILQDGRDRWADLLALLDEAKLKAGGGDAGQTGGPCSLKLTNRGTDLPSPGPTDEERRHWIRSWRTLCKQAGNCETCQLTRGGSAKEECEKYAALLLSPPKVSVTREFLVEFVKSELEEVTAGGKPIGKLSPLQLSIVSVGIARFITKALGIAVEDSEEGKEEK